MEIFWLILIGVILAVYDVVKKQRNKQVEYALTGLGDMWPELADRIGLTYEPGYEDVEGTILWFQRLRGDPMKVWGDYRSRYLYMARVAHSAGDNYADVINTEVSLDVKNSALFSLDIHQKEWLSKFSRPGKLSGWDEDLDQHLSLTGWPQEYVQIAARLIGAANPGLKAWLIDYPPHMRLTQSHLTCELGKLTDITIQLALLDLLCDLAELAERMGSSTRISTKFTQ